MPPPFPHIDGEMYSYLHGQCQVTPYPYSSLQEGRRHKREGQAVLLLITQGMPGAMAQACSPARDAEAGGLWEGRGSRLTWATSETQPRSKYINSQPTQGRHSVIADLFGQN